MQHEIIWHTRQVNGSPVEHIPVLADTLAEHISLPPDAVMVDATVGQGGHSFLFGKTLGPEAVIVGFDVDNDAVRLARSKLEELACKVILVDSNFSHISEKLHEFGIEKVDFVLADLGISSAQLADADFGLSFQTNMPLDMRLDKRLQRTAADIVNKADEKTLADLIYEFGEDRASRRIARFIVRQRRIEPVTTTGQLAQIVCRALGRKKPGRKKPGGKKPGRRSRIHPATRTFQALRIAVNDELENLKQLLASAPDLLNNDGYVAIISFHSLEDRLVKFDFKHNASTDNYRILTKKPIVPTRDQVLENRRARSAKLRIAQKQ
jgi:16S rRNA (cytosine1402-N4)-methyltransferase